MSWKAISGRQVKVTAAWSGAGDDAGGGQWWWGEGRKALGGSGSSGGGAVAMGRECSMSVFCVQGLGRRVRPSSYKDMSMSGTSAEAISIKRATNNNTERSETG